MKKIVIIIICVWLLFFAIDYSRVKKQEIPIFCTNFGGVTSIQDGGTTEYYGLGYKVIAFKRQIILNEKSNSGQNLMYTFDNKYMCFLWENIDEVWEKAQDDVEAESKLILQNFEN